MPPARTVDGKAAVGNVVVARVSVLEVGVPILAEYGDDTVFVIKSGANEVRVFDAACPHVRCALRFNKEKQRFDCPCHRSSFALNGTKLSGPAPRDMVAASFVVTGSGDVVVSGFRS
jgi:Rieske Fe-S protein